MHLNKFTKPSFGDSVFFVESNDRYFEKIKRRLDKSFDIYWSDKSGALAEIFINGKRMLLPMFQTKNEALSFGKGLEEGFVNVIHRVRVKSFASDYIRNGSYSFVVVGCKTIKEIPINLVKSNH